MDVGDDPSDSEEDHSSAPTCERSSNHKDVVQQIRRSFDKQRRTFKTMRSSSKSIAYKCNGCELTFALSLCQRKSSPHFGTWGLTKKATQQSWKVRPFDLRFFDSRLPPHVTIVAFAS